MRITSLTELGKIKEEQAKIVMLRMQDPTTGNDFVKKNIENQPASSEENKTGQNGG